MRLPSTRASRVQCAALLVVAVYIVVLEFARAQVIFENGLGFSGLFIAWDRRSTPFLVLLILLPLFYQRSESPIWGRLFDKIRIPTAEAGDSDAETSKTDILLSLSIAGASLLTSWSIANQTVGGRTQIRFGDLPPAYHDEYSYQFQANTFLHGRLANTAHPTAASLFDQMHVLNDDGVYASRYFPGTGLWMAPFVFLGNAYWGHWLAGMLIATGVYWIGRELDGRGTGAVAGFMVAVSPGLGVFSNLLLAHHPTLMGLTLFLFAFLRLMRTRSASWAAVAAIGLSFAMLCRPMTAAGFGLPFGCWWIWAAFSRTGKLADGRIRHFAAMSSPILIGFLVLLVYNHATTHSAFETPYQRYTDIYTPRHVYGFDNVVRGETRLGPKVIESYDTWAENLTPKLALSNVETRLIATWDWTLAAAPIIGCTICLIAFGWPLSVPWRLLILSIVSLHIVHVPYWYDGIMHWHYVFESSILWLLVFAGGTSRLLKTWQEAGRANLAEWWLLIMLASLMPHYLSADSLWGVSRIAAETDSLSYSRMKHYRFRQLIDRKVTQRPAIVLVVPDPNDVHIDYVNNSPNLDDDVLVGRSTSDAVELARSSFPQHTIYVFDAMTFECRVAGWGRAVQSSMIAAQNVRTTYDARRDH